MPDTLKTPSPLQLRAELQDMVRKDLLGPAGGPYEEVDERNVRGRYILGLLAPKGQSILPDEQDELAVDGAGDDQDGKTEVALPQTASMLPSSIGLTFSLEGTAESIEVTARWGRYQRVRSQTLVDDKGEPRLVWKREPVEGVSDPIPLKPGDLGPWVPDPDNPDVYVRGLCRRRGRGLDADALPGQRPARASHPQRQCLDLPAGADRPRAGRCAHLRQTPTAPRVEPLRGRRPGHAHAVPAPGGVRRRARCGRPRRIGSR